MINFRDNIKVRIMLCYRTEEEIGCDNLKEVEVPSECTEKFYKMDKEFIKDARARVSHINM